MAEVEKRVAEEMEPQLVFRREWVDQVKEMIKDNTSMANASAILRVATPLLNVKPEMYNPQFVSLGPYHHWRLEKMSTAEVYKVKSAATLSHKLREHGKSFDDIVQSIKGMQPAIERFYDWPISSKGDLNYSENFALMMAVDSSFLLCFLSSGLFGLHNPQTQQPAEPGSPTSDDDMINALSALQVCIKCDILKLENQIPLPVLNQVFDYGKVSFIYPEFYSVLYKTYTELCPFDEMTVTNYEARINQRVEPHLLGCMHAFVSPFLQMKAGVLDNVPNRSLCEKTKHFLEERVAAVCTVFVAHPASQKGQRDFLNSYSAAQLHKAGIKFKSFSNPREQIRFDKYSDTLYLPRMTVSHNLTEVFLRNMLALEFNDPARRNCVTSYVGLMDCLIDTPDDVRLLRDSHVIRRRSLMLTDESIANMWNGMCQPFFTGHLEPPEELKQVLEEELIKKYYKSKIKNVFGEFYEEYLSRPWKIIALFIAFSVLIITVVEGYCTFYECIRPSDNSKRLWGN